MLYKYPIPIKKKNCLLIKKPINVNYILKYVL